MSNLWFNIRFGIYHFQMTNEWECSRSQNMYHIDNEKFFQVHCAFGVHYS